MTATARALVPGVIALMLLPGCEPERQPAPASSPAPAAQPEAPPTGVNWATVQAATDGSHILAGKTMARHCDGWFKGSKDAFVLRHDGRSAATDGQGHSVPVSKEEWKGIQREIRLTGDEYLAVAGKARMYSGEVQGVPADSFGTIPRYKYRLEIVDEASIRFRNTGMLDDGS